MLAVNFFNRLIGNDRLTALFIISSSFLINIAYNFSNGSFERFPANNTRTFLHHAHAFRTDGFQGLIEEGLPLYYWFYPIFLTATRSFFSNNHQYFVLLVQMLLVALAAYYIFKITRLLTSQTTAVIAAFIFTLTWQILRWAHYVLPDAISTFLIILCIYYLILLAREKELKLIVPILFLTVLLLFIRPTNILFSLIVLAFIAALFLKDKKNKIAVPISIMIIIPLVILTLFSGDPANHLSSSAYFNSFIEDLQEGTVISGMPKYDVDPGQRIGQGGIFSDISHYFIVIAKRYLYFWSIYQYPHSLFHKLFNILWLGPIFAFAIYSLVMTEKPHLFTRQVNLLLLAILILYSLLHAVTEVDYDMRYRSPLLALVIIYSAHGIVSFFQAILKKGSK